MIDNVVVVLRLVAAKQPIMQQAMSAQDRRPVNDGTPPTNTTHNVLTSDIAVVLKQELEDMLLQQNAMQLMRQTN